MQVEDLNTVIRFYASQIWKRIEELDKKISANQLINCTHIEDESISIIKSKYQHYLISQEKEIEYAAKMNQRIIQIFSFFKWKSKNQFLLNLIERTLHTKLASLLEKKCLHQLINFIVDSVAPGSLIKQKEEKMRPKSRFCGRQSQHQQQINVSNHSSKRKTMSVMSSKKSESVQKEEKYSSFMTMQKQIEDLKKIYSGMFLDKNHLIKCIGNPENMKREIFKRNEGLKIKIKRSSQLKVKVKTEIDTSIRFQREVFRQLQNDSDGGYIKKTALNTNCWSRKKRRIKGSKKSKIYNENSINFH